MGYNGWYIKIIAWRELHIKQHHFVLILSFVVGVFSAVAAYLLKSSIHLIQMLLTDNFSRNDVNYWYLVFPAIGILIASPFCPLHCKR